MIICLHIDIWFDYLISIILKQINEPGSNDSKRWFPSSRSSRTGASPSDIVFCHAQVTSLSLTFLQRMQSEHWQGPASLTMTKDGRKYLLRLDSFSTANEKRRRKAMNQIHYYFHQNPPTRKPATKMHISYIYICVCVCVSVRNRYKQTDIDGNWWR